MKCLVLLAGAAVLWIASPAIGRPGNGNGHGHGHGHADSNGPHENSEAQGYGAGGCPPGLRSKGCMPPGQAKKLGRGQRYESGYGTLYSYQRIPYEVRHRYRLTSRYRYYYDHGTIYAVDPRTMLIAQVISSLLR